MDNIRFENEYLRTKDTLKEAYHYWYFRRPIAVAVYVIAAFNILLNIGLFLMELPVSPINIFLVIFITLLYPLLYLIQVNSAAKKDLQLCHGKEMKACITVTSDRFYPNRADGDIYIDLSSVNYAYETKNYIILVMKTTRLMLIFHKDGFTVGDYDGFVAFLREREIKIKGKIK